MSGTAGWYPDPGGQPGMYRYWDGSSWSATLSPSPSAPPPQQEQLSAGPAQSSGRRTGRGMWLLVGIVGAVALIVVGAFVLPRVIHLGRVGADPLPPGQATVDPCPPMPTAPPTPKPQPGDGRIHGGPVSYPELPAPWGAPYGDTRVPFGRDVYQQTVMVEENYDGGNDWVASVLVAELMAGDGFFSPKDGAAIVARCVVGRFYGDAVVTRDDKVSREATIDGHDAWILESHLSFDIDGLRTKGELMIIAVVTVDAMRSGLFYASIPDTTPELVAPAREALKGLTVDV